MAVVSRADYEILVEAFDHNCAITAYRSGRDPGVSGEKIDAYLAAKSPLAYWRGEAGMGQTALAEKAGTTHAMISAIENGKRAGPVGLWLRLAKVLGVSVEALVDRDEG